MMVVSKDDDDDQFVSRYETNQQRRYGENVTQVKVTIF